MISIDVSFTPALVPLVNLADKTVVVIDILRATSTWITALHHGAESILPMDSLEKCKKLKSIGYMIAAERGGMKVKGFDLGNSPFEYTPHKIKGKKIAVTTTNGSTAVLKSQGAKEIVIGSFLNIGTMADYLKSKNSIQLICSGWEGQPCLEDTIFSGALIKALTQKHVKLTDAAKMALRLFLRNPNDPQKLIKNSEHIKRLQKLQLQKDIDFCFKKNICNIMAGLTNDGTIKLMKN